MSTVTITDEPMSIGEVLDVASGAPVELGTDARRTIEASRGVLDRALAADEPVYGVNRGVGHGKDTRVPIEEMRRAQVRILETHAGGTGPPLPAALVRAAMVVRLNGIARGGSAASPRVAEVLAEMLNAGVEPVVPSGGSVGAGDLGQLATIGRVMIGNGRARYGGEVMPASEALARAGIEPLQVEPKDGLTIASSNAVSIGHGAMVVARAERAAGRADVVAATSLEAVRGNPSVAHAAVAAAKPFPGQAASCRAFLRALDGSELLRPGAPRSVQDPLSFRVVPQVHGAFREVEAYARRAVEVELNGRADNPLVSLEDGEIVHNGNFHPLVMAVAFDQLRVAAAHVGQLSERRASHLWDAFFEAMATKGPPPAGWGTPELHGLSLRYPAAALYAELKGLAAPATLDVPSLDIGVEDHATNAPLSVRRSQEAIGLLEQILAIEVLLASDVLGVTDPAPSLGAGTTAALRDAREAIEALRDERSPAEVELAVTATLFPPGATVDSDSDGSRT
jgi:histidine ammonia-lyase